MDRPPEASAKGAANRRSVSGPGSGLGFGSGGGGGLGDDLGSRAVSNPISYNRNASTVNQTPSTPLLLSPSSAAQAGPIPSALSDPLLDIPPDVPPPSYEEATGITAASLSRPVPPTPGSAPLPGAAPSPSMGRVNNLAVPGVRPLRPAASSGNLGAGGDRRTSAASNASQRMSGGSLGAGVGNARPGVAGGFGTANPSASAGASAGASGNRLPGYQQAVNGGAKGGQQRPAAGAGPARRAAPGSIPTGRQFPQAINLYGDNYSRQYFLGVHQHTPLYAVRVRPSWQMTNPVIALHNGPVAETSPLLAAVDHISMSDNMSITLPPPLTYRGTGSTAVRLEIVIGWTHFYTFSMEVGTDPSNVHREAFEWRHSHGDAVAALGGARDGWKLVRMSSAILPNMPRRLPAPGFSASDGREVVAIFSDARMSMSKQLKFAFVGTGQLGALGERWSVMAVTSALAIWEREEAARNRH